MTLETVTTGGRRAAGDRPVIDPELKARLEALPEDRILDFFWLMDRGQTERLVNLCWMTQIIVARPDTWNRRAIRRAHEARQGLAVIDRRSCFACSTQDPLFYHHILEVQHGGSNQVRNQVALCFTCHRSSASVVEGTNVREAWL